jgi:putative transposase
MTSPNCSELLDLYQRSLTVATLDYFQQQIKLKIRRGIYAAQVVLWLMILQRLHQVGTLAATVQLLLQGAADPLLQDCRRVRNRQISARTGGYARARLKLPVALCRKVTREITERLRTLLGLTDASKPRVYLLDGSSVQLEHCRELVRQYPPAKNQFGSSHWCVVRVVVLHELETGLAEEPQWGPMHGDKAVSEQELAERALDRLPPDAVALGDRNFGVLWVAYAAQQRKLGAVLRLTKERALKLAGGPISEEGEQPVTWKASRSDGGKHHRVPSGATVQGRLIAVRVGRGKSKQWLYLFTSLDWPIEKIVALYGQRWSIETDLRSLKRTIRLHHIAAKSNDMLEKEMLIAICAYNLVRAVMCLAARKSNIDPRQLSFAMVLNVVDCAWPKLLGAGTREQFQTEFDRVLDIASQCTLPKRTRRRVYPRSIWSRGSGFPLRKSK